jgi:hypothetical protein
VTCHNAINTIDHTILVHRLSLWYGVAATALNLVYKAVDTKALRCGVSHVSVLETLLFVTVYNSIELRCCLHWCTVSYAGTTQPAK